MFYFVAKIKKKLRVKNLLSDRFKMKDLGRFQNSYNKTHFKYALRILRYLCKTKDLKLCYRKNDNVEVVDCYVDADWEGDVNDRKSTSGYIIRLYGNVIA